MIERIQHGSRVTIVNRFGQKSTGTAVMRSSQPGAWVLNMGGKHGTPAIATIENVVKVGHTRNTKPAWRILG